MDSHYYSVPVQQNVRNPEENGNKLWDESQRLHLEHANNHANLPNTANPTMARNAYATHQRVSHPLDVDHLNYNDLALIQRQLMLQVHASRCKVRESGIDCSVPHCFLMRNLLYHVNSCMNMHCPTINCKTTKTIAQHWHSCRVSTCKVCEPIKRQLFPASNNMTTTYCNAPANNQPNDNENYQQYFYNSHRPLPYSGTSNESATTPAESDFTHSPKGYEHFNNSVGSSSGGGGLTVQSAWRPECGSEQAQPQSSPAELKPSVKEEPTASVTAPSYENDQNAEAMSAQTESVMSTNNHNNNNSSHFENYSITTVSNNEQVNSVESLGDKKPTSPTPHEEAPTTTASEDPVKSIKVEPSSTSSSNNHSQYLKKWHSDEIYQNFYPLLKHISGYEEALPFLEPVDPVALNIPDYPLIVKHPMDLSTIREKLENGTYHDPWEVIDDFWLMFSNAWLYNKKSSRVHKCCTKLAETFEKLIDKYMQNLGFCCGQHYVFQPQILFCSTLNLCAIPRDAAYFYYEKRCNNDPFPEKYYVCEKCFQDATTDVEIGADPDQPTTRMAKTLFQSTKNNVKEPEKFVTCIECGRKWHQVCALHFEEIHKQGFRCHGCGMQRPLVKPPNPFRAKRLQQTKLGACIEKRVNKFLKNKDSGANEVIIRVLYSGDKVAEVKPLMKAKFCDIGKLAGEFPYKSKAIFAFQEIDGYDVCFFGLYVQEYGSDCPKPNRGRVYVAYLDSVFFFRPKQYRTDVYHEILLGYLQYARYLGYSMAHIWACPPGEGDDYIFHMHPPDQRIPKPKRLQEWYLRLLDKALFERIVFNYKNNYTEGMNTSVDVATELPYFEGDFWSTSLEDLIKEVNETISKQDSVESISTPTAFDFVETDSQLMMMHENVPSAASSIVSGHSSSTKVKKRKGNKKSTSGKTTKKKKVVIQTYDGSDLLSKKVSELMEKHKDGFFNIRLQPNNVDPNAAIEDPDPYVKSITMDGRDNFLALSREKHLEFSSLRRAKFSTLVLLYELFMECTQSQHSCNICSQLLHSRWHCNICDDFDLCESCYARESHCHMMNFIEATQSNAPGGGSGGSGSDISVQDSRRVSTEPFLRFLVHACQCRDANCRQQLCQKIKFALAHSRTCTQSHTCGMCRRLLTMCYSHALQCSDTPCCVPYCQSIRNKKKQQQRNHRKAQAKILQRRIANMRAAQQASPAAADTPHNPETHSRQYKQPPSSQQPPHPSPQQLQQPHQLYHQQQQSVSALPPPQQIASSQPMASIPSVEMMQSDLHFQQQQHHNQLQHQQQQQQLQQQYAPVQQSIAVSSAGYSQPMMVSAAAAAGGHYRDASYYQYQNYNASNSMYAQQQQQAVSMAHYQQQQQQPIPQQAPQAQQHSLPQQQQMQHHPSYPFTSQPVRDFDARRHLQEVINFIVCENPVPNVQNQKINEFLQKNPQFVSVYHQMVNEQQARRQTYMTHPVAHKPTYAPQMHAAGTNWPTTYNTVPHGYCPTPSQPAYYMTNPISEAPVRYQVHPGKTFVPMNTYQPQ